MLLKRFYDTTLAQTSYLIGDAASGEALVVDANRDVDQYIAAAKAEGLRIAHVTETHIHADFVSGSRELAARTGAKLYLSDEGDDQWKYAFASEAGAVLLKDKDSFTVGNIRIEALHTPGHTPEHLSFTTTDTVTTDQPMGVLTGDFVFVGDVGRPDLLEKAAKVMGTMEAAARALYRSLQKFKALPDHLQIWPGHGAGSACGKSLGAVPQSTLGYEMIANWAFSVDTEEEFVRMVLSGQPEPPKYFAEMKRVNKAGPRMLGGFGRPRRLSGTRIAALMQQEVLVVDTRLSAAYATRHVPGTINIPLNASFTTWAGWLVPYDRDFYLIVDEACADCIDQAVRNLAMIGLDRVAGYLGSDVFDAWTGAGLPLASIAQITPGELAEKLRSGAVAAVDVRWQAEWEAGRIPGVPNIPLGFLADRLTELRVDKPLVVHCQGGTRSAIAASVLRAAGFGEVIDLVSGFAGWQAAGHAVDRATSVAVGAEASAQHVA